MEIDPLDDEDEIEPLLAESMLSEPSHEFCLDTVPFDEVIDPVSSVRFATVGLVSPEKDPRFAVVPFGVLGGFAGALFWDPQDPCLVTFGLVDP